MSGRDKEEAPGIAEWLQFHEREFALRPLASRGAQMTPTGIALGRALRRGWPFVSKRLYLSTLAERNHFIDECLRLSKEGHRP